MNHLSGKDRLKEKFSKLELSINEDNFSLKLTDDSVKKNKIKSVRKKNTNIVKIFFRVCKLAASSIKDFNNYFYLNIIKPFLVFCYQSLKKFYILMKEKEEYLEIYFDEKIAVVENDKKEVNENEIKKIVKVESIINEYYDNVQILFLDLIEDNKFEMPNTEISKIQLNIDFQMNLFEVISKKLIISNMIMNAKNMKITTSFEKDELLSNISIKMNKKGHAWAKMFGKYIVPELNRLLGPKSGEIHINHFHNVTKSKDHLYITINFKVIDSLIFEKPIPLQKIIKTEISENRL